MGQVQHPRAAVHLSQTDPSYRVRASSTQTQQSKLNERRHPRTPELTPGRGSGCCFEEGDEFGELWLDLELSVLQDCGREAGVEQAREVGERRALGEIDWWDHASRVVAADAAQRLQYRLPVDRCQPFGRSSEQIDGQPAGSGVTVHFCGLPAGGHVSAEL